MVKQPNIANFQSPADKLKATISSLSPEALRLRYIYYNVEFATNAKAPNRKVGNRFWFNCPLLDNGVKKRNEPPYWVILADQLSRQTTLTDAAVMFRQADRYSKLAHIGHYESPEGHLRRSVEAIRYGLPEEDSIHRLREFLANLQSVVVHSVVRLLQSLPDKSVASMTRNKQAVMRSAVLQSDGLSNVARYIAGQLFEVGTEDPTIWTDAQAWYRYERLNALAAFPSDKVYALAQLEQWYREEQKIFETVILDNNYFE